MFKQRVKKLEIALPQKLNLTPNTNPPLIDLSTIYNIDTNNPLGEESQYKTAYKATKNNKNYVVFTFKMDTNKEIDTFKRLVKENVCDKYAICPVQIGLFEGSIAIVTEFIEGITLSNLIETLQDKQLNKNVTIPILTSFQISYLYALQLFEKIVRSLQFIHNVWKFVHLDIKPDNIMIANDGSSVYIIDLGSGCFEDENCVDRFAAEDYIAPESIFPPYEKYWDFSSGKFEDWKKADIFSVGKVFKTFVDSNTILFSCSSQKEYLNRLIESMTNDDYTQRPTLSHVFQELQNLKDVVCGDIIKQLGSCFF